MGERNDWDARGGVMEEGATGTVADVRLAASHGMEAVDAVVAREDAGKCGEKWKWPRSLLDRRRVGVEGTVAEAGGEEPE